MTKKTYTILYIVSVYVFCYFNVAYAQTQPGFVEQAFWIVPKPTDGVASLVYTTIYNPYDETFIGVVELFDDTTIITTKPFVTPPHDVSLVQLSWVPTPGDHALSLRLNKTALQTGKVTKKITITDKTSSSEDIFVPKKVVPITQTTKTVSPIKTNKTTTESRPREIEIVDNAKEKIKESLDPKTSSSITTIWNSLDTYRESKYQKIENNRVRTRDVLDTTQDTLDASSASSKTVSTPFTFIKLFFLTLGAIIFSRTSIFVLVCILCIVLCVRIIWGIYQKVTHNNL